MFCSSLTKNTVLSLFIVTFVLGLCKPALCENLWLYPSSFVLTNEEGFFMSVGEGQDFPRSTGFRENPKELPSKPQDFSRYVVVYPNGEVEKLHLESSMPIEYGRLVIDKSSKFNQKGILVFAVDMAPIYSVRTQGGWERRYTPPSKEEKGRLINSLLITAYAKVMVSFKRPSGEGFKTRLGQELEIVPLENPSAQINKHAKVQVLYNGEPLAKRKVLYQVSKEEKKGAVSNFTITNSEGIARINIPSQGIYLIGVEHIVSSPKEAEYNEKRIHASLSFAIP